MSIRTQKFQPPGAGSLFSFRTDPATEYSPVQTDRFAAIKIIGQTDRHLVVAVLDGIWFEPPDFLAANACEVLLMDRFFYSNQLAVFGVATEWWNPNELSELNYLGSEDLTDKELELAAGFVSFAPGTTYGPLSGASIDAEGEWRWKFDRETYVLENEKVRQKREEKHAADELFFKTRLKGLTWEKLLSQVPFERWKESPPFPPEDFTLAARSRIHQSCRALQQLGDKPKKAEVRKVLRDCVDWFNVADEKAGFVIETEEREDICTVLLELTYVARQRSLMEEVDEWRNW